LPQSTNTEFSMIYLYYTFILYDAKGLPQPLDIRALRNESNYGSLFAQKFPIRLFMVLTKNINPVYNKAIMENDKSIKTRDNDSDKKGKPSAEPDLGDSILEGFKAYLKERLGMELVGTEVVLEAIIQKGFAGLGAKTQIYVSDILKAIELKQKLGPLTGDGIQKKIDELLNVGTSKNEEDKTT